MTSGYARSGRTLRACSPRCCDFEGTDQESAEMATSKRVLKGYTGVATAFATRLAWHCAGDYVVREAGRCTMHGPPEHTGLF